MLRRVEEREREREREEVNKEWEDFYLACAKTWKWELGSWKVGIGWSTTFLRGCLIRKFKE